VGSLSVTAWPADDEHSRPTADAFTNSQVRSAILSLTVLFQPGRWRSASRLFVCVWAG